MKVTVVCLCFNHRPYVREAIESVWQQTHHDIQLIVVDDGSSDGSPGTIREIIAGHEDILFLDLQQNHGNCAAFNKALPHIQGEFVIDLAADDRLMPGRVDEGVRALSEAGTKAGVHFGDAEYIDPEGHHLYFHSDKYPHQTIPCGNVYQSLIERYFICSPSMMFRTRVLETLGGYDEHLQYEDFDFWIRSSRQFDYIYSPSVLVQKRVLPNSLKTLQHSRRSGHMESTFAVCEKIYSLNHSKGEDEALCRRIYYEIRTAMRRWHPRLVRDYMGLLRKIRQRLHT